MFNYYILLIGLTIVSSQSDGNPHGWDRKRRCDNEDYNPPCGICEGVGGIAWSDTPKDIKITSCKPIANATDINPNTLAKPYFPEVFTNNGFYEVLIGQKLDPFCAASFPGPDSKGNHCYQAQQGTFYYDWKNYQLRIDYNQKGVIKNTTLTTLHKEGDMWILLDYNFAKACLCLDVGMNFNMTIYPVNPQFMKNDSRYIGRELLYIEYLWKEKIVDHYVKGPHHVWVDVESGHIIRMWQPFNGLEVFDPKKWDYSVQPNLFAVPPKMCKKGGYFMRVFCDDEGRYKK
jgi:hypothetical protein